MTSADYDSEAFAGKSLAVESDVDREDRQFGGCEAKARAAAKTDAVEGKALIPLSDLPSIEEEVSAYLGHDREAVFELPVGAGIADESLALKAATKRRAAEVRPGVEGRLAEALFRGDAGRYDVGAEEGVEVPEVQVQRLEGIRAP